MNKNASSSCSNNLCKQLNHLAISAMLQQPLYRISLLRVRHAGSIPYPVEKLYLPWPDISVQSHPSAISKRCWQRGLTGPLHLHFRLTQFSLCSCEKTDEALKMESKNKQRINYHMIICAAWDLYTLLKKCVTTNHFLNLYQEASKSTESDW